MKLVPLSALFHVRYGVNLELNRMTLDPDGLAFVGRSERNNGITGRVKQLPNVKPLPAGTITVAGGGSVLATFVQMEPYYSGRDLYYLTPIKPMTLAQRVYYAVCIRANKYRYNYGRQANRTLRDIQVPALESVPAWVEDGPGDLFEGMVGTISFMQAKLAAPPEAVPAPPEEYKADQVPKAPQAPNAAKAAPAKPEPDSSVLLDGLAAIRGKKRPTKN